MRLSTIRLIVVLLSLAWCALQIAVPGRFPQGDEAIFKEPGYQLARHGRMTAPPFKGFFQLSPDISETFAIYQPLYSVGYAGWLALFPHTFRSSVAYDAVIHLALVLVIMFGLPRMAGGLKAEWAAVVAGVYNFMGTGGRPDELALVLGYGGLALWLARGRARKCAWTAVAAGLLLGLAGASSLPALLILLMWAGIVWLGLAFKRSVDVGRTALVACITVLLALSVLVPFYLREGAIAQYRQHAQWFAFAGLARSFRAGNPKPFIDLLVAGFHTNIYMYPLVGLLAVAGGICLFGSPRGKNTDVRWSYLAVLAVYAFVLVCLPQQTYYYWFLIPVLMASVAAAARGPVLAACLITAATVVGGNRVCRDFAKALSLPPEQSLHEAERALIEHVPGDARLLVNPASYFVARRSHEHLYVKRQEMPDMLGEMDYCAWSSWWLNESAGMSVPAGMLSRDEVRQLKAEFTEIHNGLPSKPPSLFGLRLGREPRGFGMVIYRRTTDDG